MLSVVIATQDSERALLPTLAALVAGAAAGLVREVIVADASSRDATVAIADEAGCLVLDLTLPRGPRLKAAAGTARASWLLFLRPGVVLESNWVEETRRFIEEVELRKDPQVKAAVFRAGPLGSATIEALALLRAALGAWPDASQGLVIAKSLYDALGGHRDVQATERDLLRRVGRERLVRLQAGAIGITGLSQQYV
jgi:glycosyltransferase involved in cell wall biosynthesis